MNHNDQLEMTAMFDRDFSSSCEIIIFNNNYSDFQTQTAPVLNYNQLQFKFYELEIVEKCLLETSSSI